MAMNRCQSCDSPQFRSEFTRVYFDVEQAKAKKVVTLTQNDGKRFLEESNTTLHRKY